MSEEVILVVFGLASVLAFLVLGLWYREHRAGTFDLFALKNVFLLYVVMQFAIWPVLIVLLDVELLYKVLEITFLTHRFQYFVYGQLLVIFAVLLFLFGHRLGARKSKRQPRLSSVTVSRSRIFSALLVSCSAAVVASVLRMEDAGGVLFYLSNIDEVRTTQGFGAGIFLAPLLLSQLLALMSLAVAVKQKVLIRQSILAVLIVTLCGAMIGQRVFLLTPLLGAAVVYHRLVKPIRLSPLFVVLVTSFVFFNILYARFRSGGADEPLEFTGENSLPFFGRFHGTETLVRVLEYIDTFGSDYGVLLVISVATSFVPRAVWPDKPLQLGTIANVTLWPEAFSTTDSSAAVITLVGELLWSFGELGLLVGFLLFGFLFGRAQSRLSNTPTGTMYYVPLFLFATFVNESLSLHLIQMLLGMLLTYFVAKFYFPANTRPSTPLSKANTHAHGDAAGAA